MTRFTTLRQDSWHVNTLWPPYVRNRRALDARDRKIMRLYESGKYSQQEIADKCHLSKTVVMIILSKMMSQRPSMTQKKRTALEVRNEKMLRLYETGKWSLRRIAEKFGVHHSTVATSIARIQRKRKSL